MFRRKVDIYFDQGNESMFLEVICSNSHRNVSLNSALAH